MHVTTTKSKNSESFYISRSYKDNNGRSTSKVVKKLGTLKELSEMLSTDRDGVMEWAKKQAQEETEKSTSEGELSTVQISFHTDRHLDYNCQRFFTG